MSVFMNGFVERPRFSCALGGAIVSVTSLPEVIPIVHAAMGCAGNLSNSVSFGGGYLGDGYCGGGHIPTSSITETEIVFGGIKRLETEIKSTLEMIEGKLYVVLTGCMTEIIGDEVQTTARQYRDEGAPVIAINTPSFSGHSYRGYELVMDGIFNDFMVRKKSGNKKIVNLFGLVPGYDPFFRGDLAEIARLIRALGFSVNTFLTPDQDFQNLESAPEARLNILLSPAWGLEFVKRFEKVHGTPYWVTNLPIGAAATDLFLKQLGHKLKITSKKIDKLIDDENNDYYGYFLRTVDVFSESDYKFYAATVTNSTYATAMAFFLQEELGWIVSNTFVTEELSYDQILATKSAYKESGLEGLLIFETDASKISKRISLSQSGGKPDPDESKPFYVLGSTLEKLPAVAMKAKHLSVSYPLYDRIVVNRGYAGYRGGLNLFEDLVSVLLSIKS
jgi:nitrogenase molybdenum-iron protein beta chain